MPGTYFKPPVLKTKEFYSKNISEIEFLENLSAFLTLQMETYYISVQCDRFDYWTNIFLNEDHLKRMTGNLKRWMADHKIEIK